VSDGGKKQTPLTLSGKLRIEASKLRSKRVKWGGKGKVPSDPRMPSLRLLIMSVCREGGKGEQKFQSPKCKKVRVAGIVASQSPLVWSNERSVLNTCRLGRVKPTLKVWPSRKQAGKGESAGVPNQISRCVSDAGSALNCKSSLFGPAYTM
jgi:hypothetical protein